MNRRLTRTLCTLAALALTGATTAPTGTPKVVGAANAFLATLDAKQQARVLFKFTDDQQRTRWSNFPTGFIPRGGLSLKELSEPQRTGAMALVRATLSEQGYEKVQQIMDGDETLKSQPDNGPGGGGGGGGGGPGGPGGPGGGFGNDRGPRGGGGGPGGRGPRGRGGRGGPPGGGGDMFGKDLYYVSILGTPSETAPWMLQFGGHHLALNITIAGEHGVLTPTLTGAQPALYTLNGKTVRVLAGESDKALALLEALDETQRKQAILNYRVSDLVLGPDHDGETIQPEGLKVSTMTDKQKQMLLDVVTEWSGIVNDAYAAPRLAEIKAGLDQTWFAWSGPPTREPGKNITAYYRIQGPKVVIEYSPQSLGGDLSNHIHTMYRDPTNDYGRGVTNAR